MVKAKTKIDIAKIKEYYDNDNHIENIPDVEDAEKYFEILIQKYKNEDTSNYYLVVEKTDGVNTQKEEFWLHLTTFDELSHLPPLDITPELKDQINSCFDESGSFIYGTKSYIGKRYYDDYSFVSDVLSLQVNKELKVHVDWMFGNPDADMEISRDLSCSFIYKQVDEFPYTYKGFESAIECFLENGGTLLDIEMCGGLSVENNNERYSYNGEYFDNLTDYIRALQNSQDRCNSYKPWSVDDDIKLAELSKSMRTKELCEYFKRSRGAISSRLRKLNILNTKVSHAHISSKYARDHQLLEEFALIFLTAIINDADPLTGEKLKESSIWQHPQIKKDIEEYLNKHMNNDN